MGEPDSDSFIGLRSDPDHNPEEVVDVVTSVPSAKYTPEMGVCPTLSIALTVAVEPIATHETTDPLYVAPPAWVVTKLL